LLDASKRVGIDDAAEVLGAYRWHIPQRLWICSYFLLSPPLSFSSIVWPWEGEGNEAVFLDEVMTQYQSYTERFGMDGVPSWIIDGSIVHMGAQSVQEFINVFLDLE